MAAVSSTNPTRAWIGTSSRSQPVAGTTSPKPRVATATSDR
ncbi:MAG: hypothetical protein WB441_06175 [Nocardioidaceae bacterium]